MKKNFTLSAVFTICIIAASQTVVAQTNILSSTANAGIGTTKPNPSLLPGIISKTKGVLVPRMTKAKRDAIISPETGLLVFQTNFTEGFYFFDGLKWLVWPTAANRSLSNLRDITAVNTNLLPDSTAKRSIGSLSASWKKLYLSGPVYVDGSRVLSFEKINFNTYIGALSGFSNTTGYRNTATGYSALYSNTTGYSNTANGAQALYSNTTGSYNTANGDSALYSNTTGIGNIANGYLALYSNTTGVANTANGPLALYFNTIGYFNTANGDEALYSNTTGNFNTANGVQALYSNTIGGGNTANGWLALYYNTTGHTNTATGEGSLYYNTTGNYNTANGSSALVANTTGNYNTALGYNALYFNTMGSNNTALGYDASVSLNNLNNAMALGFLAYVNASNKVVVGNTSVTVIGGQVGWSKFSDGRFKTNIKENVPGLTFINKLKPVTYNLELKKFDKFVGKKDSLINSMQADYAIGEKKVRTGFVAQDVEKAAKELSYDFDGVNHPQNDKDNYSVVYADFVPSLVKAVQELSAKNEELTNKNDELEARVSKLEALVISNTINNANTNSGTALNITSGYLEQNSPNPFNRSTIIRYHIPSGNATANIIITDMKGIIIKSVLVSSTQNGQITINNEALAAGSYIYTLYVNGKKVDTKQMIITQ